MLKRLKHKLPLVLLLSLFWMALTAQPNEILGRVLLPDNTPARQAVIWVSDLDSIFYANSEGEFRIPAFAQQHYLKITAPGYNSKNIVLPYNYNERLLIYLEKGDSSAYFNPYEVIRLAQYQREANEKNYTAFEATTFKTSTANLHHVPFQLPIASGLILPSKRDTGIMFYSEEVSHQHYQNPYNFSDSVTAYQAAGILAAPDFNFISDKDLSFYHNKISLPELDFNEYYSPLGKKALQQYNFKALGTIKDGNRTVYRIGFEPKKYGTATLTGYMELYDSSYTVGYTHYKFYNTQHLETLDSIEVEQYFTYIKSDYRHLYTHLTHYLDINDFSGDYQSSSYHSRHRFEPIDEDLNLGKEVYYISPEAIGGDSIFWHNQRPVHTPEEAQTLLDSNNLNQIFKDKYSRSLHFHTQFKPLQLLYKRYIYREDDLYFNLSPLYYMPGYNTVEGAYIKYELPIRIYKPENEWLITPMARYGFADQEFKSRVTTEFTYDLDNPKKVTVEVGHVLDQFNEDEPIHQVINTFYSLFLSENYMKLYGKDYFRAGYQLELAHGLELQSSLEYASRYPVYNNTDFAFFGNGEDFTPNNPTVGENINQKGFEEHLALTFRAQLAYQFNQRYKTINGKKINMHMTTPRVYLNYRQGISSNISDTRFAFVSAGVTFNTDFGNAGSTRWDFSTGGFIDRSRIEFIDYQHFNGTQTFYLQPSSYYYSPIKQFSTLGYYDYSTDKAFIEAHVEHHFDGAILSKISFLRKSGIHTFTGANYLYNFEQPQFVELFFGLDNIMDILKVEVAAGLNSIDKISPSVLVGIDFNYLYYLRNKK